MDTAAGQRFKLWVKERMSAMGIKSLVELSDVADVTQGTFYSWFRGHQPTHPGPIGRVAEVLGVSYRDLLDAFDGHEKAPPGLSQTGPVSSETEAIIVEFVRWLHLRSETAVPLAATAPAEEPVGGPTRAEFQALAAESRSNSELLGRLLEQVLQAETRLSALERSMG